MKKNFHITLLIQCMVDSMYPKAGEAMVGMFNRLGISMDCSTDQTCCGQPGFNSGYWTEARTAARRFIEIFENSGTIVCPSGACADMVRTHYPTLFQDEPVWLERAQSIACRTYGLTEYLVDVLGLEDVGTQFIGTLIQALFPRHDGMIRNMPGFNGWINGRDVKPLAKQTFMEKWRKEKMTK